MPDVIHCPFASRSTSRFCGRWYGASPACPIRWPCARDLYADENPVDPSPERHALLAGAARFITISRYYRDHLQARLAPRATQAHAGRVEVAVIHSSIDAAFFAPQPAVVKDRRWAHLGRM